MTSNHLPGRAGRARVLAAVAGGALLAGVLSAPAAGAVPATALFAAPEGHGAACTAAQPCALPDAQAAARTARAGGATDVSVTLADGTYRLARPLDFTAADSGNPTHPVVWAAAPGAHPVLSGATRVRRWSAAGTDGVWAARVPVTSATRQLYVDGAEAPVAQATPAALHFAGGWSGSSTGYDLSDDPAAQSFFAALTPAQLQQVEFDYPGGNGQWTDSKCRVHSLSGTSLVMDEPCWTDTTDRSSFVDGSGGLPSMDTSRMPTTIENAASLLHPGQWFLDQPAHTLYYEPLAAAKPAELDVELPRLETLLQSAGTLAAPVHDLTFSGLTFSYATWNAPSTPAGLADVQSNLHMTGDRNQGMCTFSSPAGTCPWGNITEPHANVSLTASDHVTLTGNRFTELGGAGLNIAYGSSHNLVQGNEFDHLASTAILLGCTADPTPVNPDPAHFPDYTTTNPDTAQTIKDGCTPDPAAVAKDKIGANEIATYNTIADNVIHHIGTDYLSACGITMLFTQHTRIMRNELYDLPYSGITDGVIQGHVDDADHPDNSLNINADNTIADNLIHDHLQVLGDGGGIYMEGHQAAYTYQADGATIDFDATLGHGLQVTGNVIYDQGTSYDTLYDDAGSEWIHFLGNVVFHGLDAETGGQGGCSSTGHFVAERNYFSRPAGHYLCNSPVDSHTDYNTTIPESPQPLDVPNPVLAQAGPDAAHRAFANTTPIETDYVSAPKRVTQHKVTTTQVLIGGAGFAPGIPVYFGAELAPAVQVLSPGFLVATVPTGADAGDVSVGGYVPAPAITTPASGATGVPAAYPVAGTGVSGDVVTVTENGATLCRAPVSDGKWSCDATGSPGQHTLTARQADAAGIGSKPVSTLFVIGTPPPAARVNDTDAAFSYAGFTYSGGRGDGDYQDDLHYATDNGSTLTYTFIGTGIKVFGEQNDDQGHIGVSVDGGASSTVDTTSPDGQRHADVVVWSSGPLPAGVHTITLTKLDGSYLTFDGVEVDNG